MILCLSESKNKTWHVRTHLYQKKRELIEKCNFNDAIQFVSYKGPVHISKFVNGGLTWENLNNSKCQTHGYIYAYLHMWGAY